MTAPTSALLVDWENAVALASPGFMATNVSDGLYDIGTYGGEQTYEFIVKSNPNETEASMCLIGRRVLGGAGLKFDQWPNTGEYGATLFYVVDLYFGVPNNPGVDTHLVFVSSQAAGTCSLYVNGVYKASVGRAISLSGTVGIGYAAEGDDFDGVIYGVAIYDGILSDSEIQAHADAYFLPPEVTLVETALFIMDEVDSGNIDPELEESLLAKIDAALKALEKDTPNAAKVATNVLNALINQIEAQLGKKITPEVGVEIIQRANAIIAALGG